MKIKKLAFLSTILAVLLPTLVVATVVISYTYPVVVSTTDVVIQLETGENYPIANEFGFMSIGNIKTSGQPIPSGTTINIAGTADSGAGNTTLLNVLKIVNSTSSNYKFNGGTLKLWINGTLPSGVTLYYSYSLMTFGTPSGQPWISGTQYTLNSGNPITLPSSTTIYISFQINGGATGSGVLYLQYSPT